MVRIARSAIAVGLLASLVAGLRMPEQVLMGEDFSQIPASSKLSWTPCYGRFECAKLIVPLDYFDYEAGNTTVAFIRLNAGANVTQDVIFNPGGPGVSGIGYLLNDDKNTTLAATGNRYNAVSFDPRGVNNSGIVLTCFPDEKEARNRAWGDFETSSWSSDRDQAYHLAMQLGKECVQANRDTNAKYVGTMAVVQDLMHFTTLQAAQRNEPKPEEVPVNYYGISYGTTIGHTLAATYVQRVGRMILDGNQNSEDWYKGADLHAVEDVDLIYDKFFTLCQTAGPENCSFYATDVKKRFDDLLAKMANDPINSSIAGESCMFQNTSYNANAVLAAAHGIMYAPVPGFQALVDGLAALEEDDLAEFCDEVESFHVTDTEELEKYVLISAADAAGHSLVNNLDSFHEVFDLVNLTSVYAGRKYALESPLVGAAVRIIPPKSQIFPVFTKVSTSTPILFLNPSADPITPISSARHMARYFEGSVVLEQNSLGHSTGAASSNCTAGWIQKYFETAELPEQGTVCQPDDDLLYFPKLKPMQV